MESGVLEFFVFSSVKDDSSNMNKFKKVQYDLATISGFAPLPPINYLGFHFCKWDWVSADRMIERNANFTKFDIAVDVLWMDIQWADNNSAPEGYEYFVFNPQNFTENSTDVMNKAIKDAGRGIVVIVDPHIKAVEEYAVFSEGMAIQQ
jgi:alpha-glucosidase (family GH31 glycosyl hydrolase)